MDSYNGSQPMLSPQVANNNRQYSQVTKMSLHPKKEQAIVLNVNESLKLEDYVVAIGNLVQPKNILFASRISNNRICIYLSNVKLVDNVTQQEFIRINGIEIGLRRLITPAKKLILSNVIPSISHETLEQEIVKLGYKTASPMSFLRAGIAGPEYAHILSFRRQIYVTPDDNIELPSSLLIPHDNTFYRIFLTFDTLTCFLCKAAGHIAKQCPNQTEPANLSRNDMLPELQAPGIVATGQGPNQVEPTENATPAQDQTPKSTRDATPTTLMEDPEDEAENPANSVLPLKNAQRQTTASQDTRQKRPPPPSTPSSSDLIDCEFPTLTGTGFKRPEPVAKPRPKRRKADKIPENLPILETLKPLETIIRESPTPYVLNFEQFAIFLESVYGSPDPLSIANTYTSDTEALLKMIEELKPHIDHTGLKSRCTRLRKKIEKQLSLRLDCSSSNDSESDCSQTSQKSY